MSKSPKLPSPRKMTFEQAMERLAEISELVESGEVGLEESADRYEEAMKLYAHCRRILDRVEQRVQQIQEVAGDELERTPLAPQSQSRDATGAAADADDAGADVLRADDAADEDESGGA